MSHLQSFVIVIFIGLMYLLLRLGMVAKHCDEYVCLSVCLRVCLSVCPLA